MLKRTRLELFLATLLLTVSIAGAQATKPAKPHDPKIWEKEIVAFEKQDSEHMPEPGGVVFTGSSSIRKWKLETSFPTIHPINRGIGGSFTNDCIYYADRAITKYHPRLVVILVGENDLWSGKKVDLVEQDFVDLVGKIQSADKSTKVILLSQKPSPKRFRIWPELQEMNAWEKNFADDHDNVKYVDVSAEMLGPDGQPRAELYQDGLHPSEKGYAMWNRILGPYLEK